MYCGRPLTPPRAFTRGYCCRFTHCWILHGRTACDARLPAWHDCRFIRSRFCQRFWDRMVYSRLLPAGWRFDTCTIHHLMTFWTCSRLTFGCGFATQFYYTPSTPVCHPATFCLPVCWTWLLNILGSLRAVRSLVHAAARFHTFTVLPCSLLVHRGHAYPVFATYRGTVG